MEEYIHEDVLKLFARSFITGFVNLMLELGFDPNLQGTFYLLPFFFLPFINNFHFNFFSS